MDDLELINLASKASGFEYTHNNNPLVSDALALRLAVKLGIVCSPGRQIYTNDDDRMGAWADRDVKYGTEMYQQVEWSKTKGDPYAATRRAIVRAAAEIGKEMT